VLVSATVPNINDVADWIGSGNGESGDEPALVFKVRLGVSQSLTVTRS
jgi:replicative superfamily II helicase